MSLILLVNSLNQNLSGMLGTVCPILLTLQLQQTTFWNIYISLIFQRNQGLTFHVNHLPCFLWKIMNKLECVQRAQMTPPEKLKCKLLMPEKLKHKLLMLSWTRTQMEMGRRTGVTLYMPFPPFLERWGYKNKK